MPTTDRPFSVYPQLPRCPKCGEYLAGRWQGDDLHEVCPACGWQRTRTLPKIREEIDIARIERMFPRRKDDADGD